MLTVTQLSRPGTDHSWRLLVTYCIMVVQAENNSCLFNLMDMYFTVSIEAVTNH